MCGIAGILGPGAADKQLLERMGGALVHRGPNDHGIWSDPEAGIGLSHRRLAVVDLSPQGRQPMASSDGRWVICFNGEIYNHVAVRRQLDREGRAPPGGWRGHSDTETLVEAVAAYGPEQAIGLAVGMFAFALWDRKARQLHLVRDRFGEKPLYVGQVGRDLIFASELKPFRQHPEFSYEISKPALAALLSSATIPGPWSIYRGVSKLAPATILTVDTNVGAFQFPDLLITDQPSRGINCRRYWMYRDVVEQGANTPFLCRSEAEDAVELALAEAISDQSVADVPIGAFLSGGVDSSLVAALYQRGASRPINTYTIGFSEPAFDESAHAAAIARHLGTDHHELVVTPAEAREVIPQLPGIYDEPFADSSQIPTFIVSRFARRSVTVALSGDGGDELFAGYNRHVLGSRFWAATSQWPAGLRSAGAGALSYLPPAFWSAGTFMPRGPQFGWKIQKGLKVAAAAHSLDDVYASFVDEWYGQPFPLLGGERWKAAPAPISADIGPAARLAYWDAMSYLPDDILVKVDRAAMAVGLETRVPFLDHRVAAVAARVPDAMKIDRRGGKAILRDVLARHVPPQLFERPKTGFGIPLGDWLRGPLREWAEELLDRRRLEQDGWFDATIVRQCWRGHLSGRRDATAGLWAILMFNAWLDHH